MNIAGLWDQLVDAVCRPPRDNAYTEADLVGGRRASFRWVLPPPPPGAATAAAGCCLPAQSHPANKSMAGASPCRLYNRKYYRQDVVLQNTRGESLQ